MSDTLIESNRPPAHRLAEVSKVLIVNVALNLSLWSFAATPTDRSVAKDTSLVDTSLVVCMLPLIPDAWWPSSSEAPRRRPAGATVTVGPPVVVKFEHTESWQGRVVEAH
jgi:hypothetical protein